VVSHPTRVFELMVYFLIKSETKNASVCRSLKRVNMIFTSFSRIARSRAAEMSSFLCIVRLCFHTVDNNVRTYTLPVSIHAQNSVLCVCYIGILIELGTNCY